MLQSSPIHAYIPATDVARARRFYEQKLGFTPGHEEAGGVMYEFANRTSVFLYPTPNAGTNRASQAFWEVSDVEREVAELKARGVTFEEYDTPGMKTRNGIATAGGGKVAWFKDTEGNIMAIVQESPKKAPVKLQFSTRINASQKDVWDTIIGQQSFKDWTAPFMEGSHYEGSWEKGQKIRFLAPGGSGMSSMIAENRPYEFISIKHVGQIKDGVEDTQSEEVRAWAPAFENYTLVAAGSSTELRVDMDTSAQYEGEMRTAWPKALRRLKELAEKH